MLRPSRGFRVRHDPAREAETPNTPIHWRRLFAYLAPYKGRMAVAIFALAIYSAIGLAFPLMIVQLLSTALPQAATGAQSPDFTALNTLAAGLAGLFLLQSIFSFVQSFNLTYIGEHIILDLRTGLYKHLHDLSLEFFANRRVGELISRISSDVTQVRGVLTSNITQLLSQSISLVGSVVIVFVINPRLTLFILFLAPVLTLVAIIFGRSFQGLSTKVSDAQAISIVAAEEALQGVRVVKSFTREGFEVQRYTGFALDIFKNSMRLAVLRSLFGSTMAFLGFGSVAAILWFGGREVIMGNLTLPQITGFLLYGISIATSLGGLAALYGQIREALGAIRRVFEIMDIQPGINDIPNAKELPTTTGRITFDNVYFSYDSGINVLEDINLDIAPGEIIALVGPSGAGKTTLFNLIPRFYDPTAGAVSIDGNELRTLKQTSLRGQIGIVPQETLLFGGTIRENIAYGRLDATEAEITAAAKAANAEEFILSFPAKYETVVGERGVKLSGGQRQRVAIARALLKDPRILLLDEATSSLDSESEGLVQEALDRLMQNRTTVMIAHRLSTIKVAHRIAVLEHGKIVELGTHDELMAKAGLYMRLYNMQFRYVETDDIDAPTDGSITSSTDSPAVKIPGSVLT